MTIDLKGFEGYKVAAAYKMFTEDMELKNSYGNDEALMPVEEEKYSYENGEFKVYVKPLSWNVYVFEA